MRTERQAHIDRLIIRTLASASGYPFPEGVIRDHLALRVVPPVQTAEVNNSLAYLESQLRISSIQGETCLLWELTDAGRGWWSRNQFA